MVNAEEGYGAGEELFWRSSQNIKTPIFLIINKIDGFILTNFFLLLILIKKNMILLNRPISALEGNNVDQFTECYP